MMITFLSAWLLGLSATPSTPAAAEWQWQGVAAILDVDLVRADVRIVASPDAAMVRIVPAGPGAVAFSSAATANGVAVHDRYPPRGRWSKECLPPVGERGDYWTYAVPLQVTIAVPAGTRVRVRLMSGSIRAHGVRGPLDLKTGDGVVERGG